MFILLRTVTIKPKINTKQSRFSQNLAKSVLWSGPYKIPISALLKRKTRNLVSVKILMTWHHPVNLVKSGDLIQIFWAVLYFTDQLFSAFYRLFCKIANLWDIDLKFSGFISDVNSDNPAKFREVSMPRSCISKNRVFQDFGL